MSESINLFDDFEYPTGPIFPAGYKKYPIDYRWDINQNGKLLSIVFVGGCFGNFLKYFIERFSTKTPAMEEDPFTDLGTSHAITKRKFSGLVQRYHLSFMNDNQKEKDLPICLILPSLDPESAIAKKHLLYMTQSRIFRAGDRKAKPDHLWQKAIGEMTDPGLKSYVESIIKLYNIKDPAHFTWLPKFIVRDWYKLSFLEEFKEQYHYRFFKKLETHDFFKKQKTHRFALEAFFDWQNFIREIKELDNVFGLSLNFTREAEMKEIFEKGLELDELRQECNLAEKVIERDIDIDFVNLDVSTEAFIYAEMEKKNDFIQMPTTNRFFRDTAELYQFIEHYPTHYKAMNPNMPKFNGIANPYYLDKQKKSHNH
jgi:hypothetical protein